MSQAGGPDWTVIGGAIVTIGGAAAAIIAGMRGAFDQRKKDVNTQGTLQLERDRHATDNAARTLEGVFQLVEQLQEENKRKDERIEVLDQRLAQCEAQGSQLLRKIGDLDQELNLLRVVRHRMKGKEESP